MKASAAQHHTTRTAPTGTRDVPVRNVHARTYLPCGPLIDVFRVCFLLFSTSVAGDVSTTTTMHAESATPHETAAAADTPRIPSFVGLAAGPAAIQVCARRVVVHVKARTDRCLAMPSLAIARRGGRCGRWSSLGTAPELCVGHLPDHGATCG